MGTRNLTANLMTTIDGSLADLVLVVTFTGIACIPIEPFNLLEVDHECIFLWYTTWGK
jgi:hypothetical protein